MATFKGNVCSTPAYIPQADLYKLRFRLWEYNYVFKKTTLFRYRHSTIFENSLSDFRGSNECGAHTPNIYPTTPRKSIAPERIIKKERSLWLILNAEASLVMTGKS